MNLVTSAIFIISFLSTEHLLMKSDIFLSPSFPVHKGSNFFDPELGLCPVHPGLHVSHIEQVDLHLWIDRRLLPEQVDVGVWRYDHLTVYQS